MIPDFSIILAGGRGTRMKVASTPKVCIPVNGIPAIQRALGIYQSCGIRQHLVIVGNQAGKVIETVGEKFSNVAYVYQKEQLGTAHALRCVCQGLPSIPDDADLLVVAGDRIIEPGILEQLFDKYYSNHADLALLALRCRPRSGQGRLYCDPDTGTPVAILEMADIRQRMAYQQLRTAVLAAKTPAKAELRKLLEETFFGPGREVNAGKGECAFAELWRKLYGEAELSRAELLALLPEERTFFQLQTSAGRQKLMPAEAEALPYGNTSVYLLKYRTLRNALQKLSRDNAQGEEYLSDLLNIVWQEAWRDKKTPAIAVLKVDDLNRVLGFNNPAELLEVEAILSANTLSDDTPRWKTDVFWPLQAWQNYFFAWDDAASPAGRQLVEIYGQDHEIIARQASIIMSVLEQGAGMYPGNTPVGLVRMPGRLNVMGRHVDHQGGNCNLMTISFETVMLVHPRQDDIVTVRHCDPANFSGSEFSISEVIASLPWEDWNSVVNSEALMKRFREYGVHWSEYIKAAVLRLQKKFPTRPLHGMDVLVAGNIPMAAGLSSSSSLIVGAAEAAVAANNLDTFPAQLVTLCGEGEWFVGTRGGSADHAAVKMGRQGSVVKVRFFDFAVEETVPFPDDYAMVVCDSGIQARKSSAPRDQFNHRISCYRIGFELIRQLFPQYRALLQHLRDVNVRTLNVPLAKIYRILLALPEKATLPELQAMLPGIDIQTLCASHNPPADGLYPIRGVVLFGLSECERSAAYVQHLKNGEIATIGKLMKVSHNGDRVVSYTDDWQEIPYLNPMDNAYILDRLSDLESGLPERVIRAQLIWQPGAYSCSLPAIDLMTDIANRTPGVAGAQLAGAGLGGCMMVLCQKKAIADLQSNLKKIYYGPAGKEPAILVCRPVAGGGMLKISQ
jgi:N-acetylgalactosamine kinase